MSLRAVDAMRTLALVGATLAAPPGIAQTRRRPRPAPVVPPVVSLRPDGCPEAQPTAGARCEAAIQCAYPPFAAQRTLCQCYTPLLPGGQRAASNLWACSPYVFQGVGPLSPPEFAG